MLSGHVVIALAGEKVTLVPTLGAAITLNTMHSSFIALLAKLEAYDFDASVDVVHHGLGRSEADRARTEEQVFAAGLLDLAPDLIAFVIRLMNGGKPASSAEEEESAGPFATSAMPNISNGSSAPEPAGSAGPPPSSSPPPSRNWRWPFAGVGKC
ncbi:MAG: hypothetical protein B7Z15_07320 [Rhizobiales bacterium 32-66-8]|nr:MAG: hypothetical protein B7Z15_07320 [Rhizobiales bacterium 32-66-8]